MSFDALAPHYRWMEFLLAGEKLQRCRTTFLDQVANARNVLILGEGHGRFLIECRRRLSHAHITCVDASERMLEVARARLARAGLNSQNISFVHADALNWEPHPARVDLIVTQFFLDCFRADQLQRIIERLARLANPGASWLLADFQAPAAGLPALRARIILKSMYLFFRAATRLPAKTLTLPDPFLRATGFALHQRRISEWGLLHTDHWIKN
jgi:ubiquinone/menaquinone biosynthesis C-methylase UbiE